MSDLLTELISKYATDHLKLRDPNPHKQIKMITIYLRLCIRYYTSMSLKLTNGRGEFEKLNTALKKNTVTFFFLVSYTTCRMASM